ncbi:MAG TPA: hypothetical protein VKQ34_04770 [Candidatus Saccharimonadales bacterium]|nr:hypothetical protein [Candidatus Saccharimonadales bacterium]
MEQLNPKDVEPTYRPPHYPYMGGKSRGRKKLLLAGLVGLVVLVVAAGSYWFFVRHRAKSAPVTTRQQQTTQAPSLSPEVAATTQTFKSAKLNVQVTYRKDWTLKESADKSEIVLSSPNTVYQKNDGTTANAPFTVKIREDVPDAMQTAIQKAVASEDSTIIAYTQPAPTQRQYTNLSFAGATPSVFSFFMVTGNNAYKVGDPFGAGIDLTGTTYIIAGGYGADKTDALAFDPVPKASAESTVYDQALDIVKSLQVY